MIPNVTIKKKDGNSGVVRPGVEGILAIIAPCEKGTQNLAGGYAKADLAQDDFGYGALTDINAYVMPVAGNPTLLIRPIASTAGAYSAFTHTGAGSSVATAGGTAPFDDFDVIVKFIAAGTIGVAGITYQYSLDGGRTYSGVLALGTANSIVIPNTNVTIALAAGTILANQLEAFKTTGPRMTNGDLVTALEALRVSSLPWEAVIIAGCDADATILGTLDVWLQGREAEGKFRLGILNSRPKNAGETEAQYSTAMGTAWNAASSIRITVCTDAADVVSQVRGILMKRPVAVPVAARCMEIDVAESPAYVAPGGLPAVFIDDGRGNPKHHDEAKYPGLDDLRLCALRTIDQKEGVYVNRPRVLSPSGSDWQYIQHVRTMNKACEMAYQLLTNELNKGVRRQKANAEGKIFILEEDAAAIEQRIDLKLKQEFEDKKRCSGIQFALSRTDDLGSVPVKVNASLDMAALAYIDEFEVAARLVRSITAKTT